MNPTAHPRRWLILWLVLAGEVVDVIDGTIVNVAAPNIARDLHASSTGLQWIVGGYPLAVAIGLITGARLGDLVGRGRLFLLGLAGFTLASALCGLAPSEGTLIATRLLQGGAAAFMLPQGFGILQESFPPDELPKVFGIFGPVIGGGAVLGPILGGALTDANLFGLDWRLVFFVNLPLGIAALVTALRFMPRGERHPDAQLDLVGAALSGLAMFLIVLPLIQGRDAGWPLWTYLSMAGSVVVLLVFAVQQRSRARAGRDPLVVPSIFAQRGFSSGLLVAMGLFAAMMGVLLTVSVWLQVGHGFSPLQAGLTFVPYSAGLAVGAGLAGGLLAPRFGRKVLQAGLLIAAAGAVALVASVDGAGYVMSGWRLAPAELVFGLGTGLVIAPMFDIILAAVGEGETGSASGVLNAMQQLSGSIGVAAFGTVFFDHFTRTNVNGALQDVLWGVAGVLLLTLLVTPLLPRFAREESPAAPGVAEAVQPAAVAAG